MEFDKPQPHKHKKATYKTRHTHAHTKHRTKTHIQCTYIPPQAGSLRLLRVFVCVQSIQKLNWRGGSFPSPFLSFVVPPLLLSCFSGVSHALFFCSLTTMTVTLSVVPLAMARSTRVCAIARLLSMSRITITASSSLTTSHSPSHAKIKN